MKLEKTRKPFFFQAGYEYNTLPREIISEKGHKNFKAKIRKIYNHQN